MEIGLYAESAGLSSLDETIDHARRLGITRLELSTGGQSSQPFLDVDALLDSATRRQDLLTKLVFPLAVVFVLLPCGRSSLR